MASKPAFDWASHRYGPGVLAVFRPRRNYVGAAPVGVAELMARAGTVLELRALWLMDAFDPYPGEWALGHADRRSAVVGSSMWIASGDVEVQLPKPAKRAKRPPRDQHPKAALKAMRKARDFPGNTCAASRHAALIAEHLIKQGQMHMLTDEPGHCGESIAHTVAALWRARARLERLRARVQAVRDANAAEASAGQTFRVLTSRQESAWAALAAEMEQTKGRGLKSTPAEGAWPATGARGAAACGAGRSS